MHYLQRRHWLWLMVQLGALLALAWTIILIDKTPAQKGPYIFVGSEATRLLLFTGKSALIFLVLSLACTPAARLFGWRQAITVRKTLGLWGVGFALLHASLFMGGKAIFTSVDAWRYIWGLMPYILSPNFLKTPYARDGALALLLLLPLAATSNRMAMRWLGKGWKRLHRLVYLAVPLAVYHYWQREQFLSHLVDRTEKPDYLQPILFAAMVLGLLLARLPLPRQARRKH